MLILATKCLKNHSDTINNIIMLINMTMMMMIIIMVMIKLMMVISMLRMIKMAMKDTKKKANWLRVSALETGELRLDRVDHFTEGSGQVTHNVDNCDCRQHTGDFPLLSL